MGGQTLDWFAVLRLEISVVLSKPCGSDVGAGTLCRCVIVLIGTHKCMQDNMDSCMRSHTRIASGCILNPSSVSLVRAQYISMAGCNHTLCLMRRHLSQ